MSYMNYICSVPQKKKSIVAISCVLCAVGGGGGEETGGRGGQTESRGRRETCHPRQDQRTGQLVCSKLHLQPQKISLFFILFKMLYNNPCNFGDMDY